MVSNIGFLFYHLVGQEVEAPASKELMIASMVKMNAFIEISLFMKEAIGYDSRIWFETPGHELDKEANALLR